MSVGFSCTRQLCLITFLDVKFLGVSMYSLALSSKRSCSLLVLYNSLVFFMQKSLTEKKKDISNCYFFLGVVFSFRFHPFMDAFVSKSDFGAEIGAQPTLPWNIGLYLNKKYDHSNSVKLIPSLTLLRI